MSSYCAKLLESAETGLPSSIIEIIVLVNFRYQKKLELISGDTVPIAVSEQDL